MALPVAVAGGLLSAGGSVLGGILGSSAKQDAADRQAEFARDAARGYSNIQLPTIDEQLLQLQEIRNAGNLTPEQEIALQQQESVLNSYKANPEAYTAQMQALQKYTKMADQGLTDIDKANLNQILSTVNNTNASNQAAIGQNMAQRGMSGSGMEAAHRLLSGQSAAQTASDQGFQTAAQNQQAKLAAIENLRRGGIELENQSRDLAVTKAQQQNAINQSNTQNARDTARANIDRFNTAQAANLTNQQQLNAANADIKNREQIANKGLPQSNFQNEMVRQAGIANAQVGQATAAGAQGAADAALWSGMGEAASKVGTGLMNYGLAKKTNKFDPETGKAIG